jgi:lipoate---protein ligase
MSIRVVDAGEVSGWRSQSAYHGVARVLRPDDPDTIVVLTPGDPHVCVGYHQNVTGEVDLDYCRKAGLPVIRREIGGGTVLLNRDQLFVQWIFHPSSLPRHIGHRFALFTQPMVSTLKAFGIDAEFVPANDVQVAGRKIGATGAGAVEDAEIVVGNFVLDFDHDLMTRVLSFPDDTYRSHFRTGLGSYMTTMRRELGESADAGRVKEVYLQSCAEVLGEELSPGAFTSQEIGAMEATEARFATDQWLLREGGLERPGKKIHSNVWVYRTELAAPGGTIRTTVRLRNDLIEEITFDCSFPVVDLGPLQSGLRHVQMAEEPVAAAVDRSLIGMSSSKVHRDTWIQAALGARKLTGVA